MGIALLVCLDASGNEPGANGWTNISTAPDGSSYSYRADRVEYNSYSKSATVWYRYWSRNSAELTFANGKKIKYRYMVGRIQLPCNHSAMTTEQMNYYDDSDKSVYLQTSVQSMIPEPDSVLDVLTNTVCPK